MKCSVRPGGIEGASNTASSALLFALDLSLCRPLDVFASQFVQLLFGFSVSDSLGVPPAFLRFVSQICGAFGHWPSPQDWNHLSAKPKPAMVKTAQPKRYSGMWAKLGTRLLRIGRYSTRGFGFTFLGASSLSTSQTTLFFAASRDGDMPDRTAFSSSWTVHFHE